MSEKSVYFFFADYCDISKKMMPKIKSIEEKVSKSVSFKYFDLKESVDIFRKYNITEVPQVVLLENEQVKESYIGLILIKPIRKKIKDFIKADYD